MNKKEEIFFSQLKNLRRSIHADISQSGVFVCDMLDYIASHIAEQERAEYCGMMLNELLCDDVIDNAQLCQSSLLPAINAYRAAAVSDRTDTEVWVDIFERYIGAKTGCHHPIVYADILRICRSDFHQACSENVSLPLSEDVNLSNVMKQWRTLFERFLQDGSSWTLLRDADCRNALARFLCSQAESHPAEPLRIVFPFSGTGIEPLLLAYTVSLMSEAMSGHPAEMKLVLLGDPAGPLRSMNPNDTNYDETFLNLKKTFCEQNHIKIKDVKTTLKAVKRKITVMTAEEWRIREQSQMTRGQNQMTRGHAPLSSDFAVINFPDGDIIGDFENIILECSGRDIPKLYESKSVIISSFDKEHECEVKFIHCVRKNMPEQTAAEGTNRESPKGNYIEQLYAVRHSFSPKEMKKKLAVGDYIVSEKQMIQYAELLAMSAQYGKAFQVIRQHFESDYDKSYQLLQEMLLQCKNNKINEAINRFIVEKEMKPNGFGEAMLEAVIDGIEDYFDTHPDSVLKDKQWL